MKTELVLMEEGLMLCPRCKVGILARAALVTTPRPLGRYICGNCSTTYNLVERSENSTEKRHRIVGKALTKGNKPTKKITH